VVSVRPFEPRDAEGCRRLWEELTGWHRQIFDSPEIGGEDPGRGFDEHLDKVGPENLRVAELEEDVVDLAGLIPGVESGRPGEGRLGWRGRQQRRASLGLGSGDRFGAPRGGSGSFKASGDERRNQLDCRESALPTAFPRSHSRRANPPW
jgi:hypothetical protein